MTTPEVGVLIAIAKDIVIGLAAASTATFAYLGLSTWRKELKGKAEYELAKDVLKSVYRVREAFKQVRHPAILQYEYPADMTDQHGYLQHDKKYEGTAYVYERRWKMMDEVFRELEEYHLAAQVEWGSEFQDVIAKLRGCRAELFATIQQLLKRIKNPNPEPRNAVEKEAEEKSVLYHLGNVSKFDKFTPEIDAAVEDFEKWLRPHIRNRT